MVVNVLFIFSFLVWHIVVVRNWPASVQRPSIYFLSCWRLTRVVALAPQRHSSIHGSQAKATRTIMILICPMLVQTIELQWRGVGPVSLRQWCPMARKNSPVYSAFCSTATLLLLLPHPPALDPHPVQEVVLYQGVNKAAVWESQLHWLPYKVRVVISRPSTSFSKQAAVLLASEINIVEMRRTLRERLNNSNRLSESYRIVWNSRLFVLLGCGRWIHRQNNIYYVVWLKLYLWEVILQIVFNLKLRSCVHCNLCLCWVHCFRQAITRIIVT